MDQPHHSSVTMDLQAALVALDGDDILLQELIALCLRDAPSLLASIRDAVARRDGPSLAHAAHTLKGSVQQLCARDTAAAAQQMEDIGRAREWRDADEALIVLERRFADLVVRLMSMQAHDSTASIDTPPNRPVADDSSQETHQ
jgi:HPt (histidine-containing phosphotransfer) domain-containing protein